MSRSQFVATILTIFFLITNASRADQPITLPDDPDLSADGKRIVFAWRGDVWMVGSNGGVARQITSSSARDGQPKFSPDGKTLAFVSERTGPAQVYTVPASGGSPTQLTFHSEGCTLDEWSSDGESLLISAIRDHFWRWSSRFFLIGTEPSAKEQLLFNDYGSDGRLSPDEGQLLFTREGERWWRKGYHGSRASQIWKYDVQEKSFTQICNQETESRTPLWHPDGKHFYYVGGQSGAFNIWRRNLDNGEETQLTNFPDDSVVAPCISRDGKVIVFRHGFHLYRMNLANGGKPKKLNLVYRGDDVRDPIERTTLTSATEAAFSSDGLEIAFIAGGDLWVMDTVLKEPRQITATPEEEREPVFAPDGNSILFISDAEGQSDIWRATRGDDKKYWWQNDEFKLDKLTNDSDHEFNLDWSPDGSRVAFLKSRGDLWIMKPDGSDTKKLLSSWNGLDYDWSPDGNWIVCAQYDNEFNRDVFIMPIDGSREPFNISRHPDNDFNPVWSPDGKVIAFAGRRMGEETDIYFVNLLKSEDETDARDRRLKEAIEKLSKGRKPSTPAPATQPATPEKKPDDAEKPVATEEKKETTPSPKTVREVVIDFDGIEKRLHRVAIADASEVGLFWSPDSKRLAFTAKINGKQGTYTISPPTSLTPTLLTEATGSRPQWITQGNQIFWLVAGKPSSLNAQAQAVTYTFSALHAYDVAKKYEAAFELCWREMRDNFYDGKLNNRNWDAIRRKYVDEARGAVDKQALSTVVNMMLGELNGSHLGFSATGSPPSTTWRETTAHFGVRFDDDYKGPGLKIRDVIRSSPADKVASKLEPGEVILAIDGTAVDPDMELTSLLNGPLARDIVLKVKNTKDVERSVTIRPISFSAARALLYEQWIHDSQALVAKMSNGRFGYVHIAGMNETSFYRFEQELFSVASGKDGLIIDVRENGGGSTTDHLLTVLTQPDHAITVPRGGGPGYPQDRRVYATWNKPIVVLCNQNSFSNAEIFSHAIKTLDRGQLVGVPTAGGVISTGATRIMDVGLLRKPFRGWFVLGTGEDMELNGAVPHHIIWPKPSELPSGTDTQLNKAIEELAKDVEAWKKQPEVKLIKASERKSSSR